MTLETDLAPFFSLDEFAVAATFSGDTQAVLFQVADLSLLDDQVQSAEYQAVMPAGTFAALARGSSITIGGQAYTVRHVMRIGDGALKRATLTKAA